MISRRAQLKGQDQKVASLTDDFTMRNFISVRLPPSSLPIAATETGISSYLPLSYKNPRFIQEKAYEPVILNIPLLGGSAEGLGTSHDPVEPASDAIVAVEEDEQPFLEARGTATDESPPLKKIRTIRFAE
jgi:hypothetical protein